MSPRKEITCCGRAVISRTVNRALRHVVSEIFSLSLSLSSSRRDDALYFSSSRARFFPLGPKTSERASEREALWATQLLYTLSCFAFVLSCLVVFFFNTFSWRIYSLAFDEAINRRRRRAQLSLDAKYIRGS